MIKFLIYNIIYNVMCYVIKDYTYKELNKKKNSLNKCC